jgi:hypothetical protein
VFPFFFSLFFIKSEGKKKKGKKKMETPKESKAVDRKEVIHLLLRERSYQELVWPHKHSVGEELLLMEEYIQSARKAWVTERGDECALDILRKVTAMGIRCMENNGIVRREGHALLHE